MSSPISDHELSAAETVAASEQILIHSAKYGPQGSSAFMFDPASGTLIVRPEAEAVISQALCREARRIAFRLRLRQPGLEIRYFAISCSRAGMRCCMDCAISRATCRRVSSTLIRFAPWIEWHRPG
jgi:hypothetical protein